MTRFADKVCTVKADTDAHVSTRDFNILMRGAPAPDLDLTHNFHMEF